MRDFPATLKHITVWLLLGTAIFVGVQFWQAQQKAERFQFAGGVIELRRGPDGHFHWPGTVNGQAVDFLVDTGATRTTLPRRLAAGLEPEGRVQAQTAGGVVQGYSARTDLTLEGGLRVSGITVTVLPDLGAPLLGMDVLSRLRFTQTGGVLRLEPASR